MLLYTVNEWKNNVLFQLVQWAGQCAPRILYASYDWIGLR